MCVGDPGSNPEIICFFLFCFFFAFLVFVGAVCYTRRRSSFFEQCYKTQMVDVPFTIVALKASVRKHNESNTVRLSQKRASLISDMRKKGVAFPRDPRKHSKSKSVALPKQKKKKRRIAPMQVASQYAGGAGMQGGMTDGQKTAASAIRKISARAMTRTDQFRKDKRLAKRIRGDLY